jgi:hypothetical protein
MIYIPDDWIRNKANRQEIELIFEYLFQDIITSEMIEERERKIERLNLLGEDILYSKLVNNEIIFGA